MAQFTATTTQHGHLFRLGPRMLDWEDHRDVLAGLMDGCLITGYHYELTTVAISSLFLYACSPSLS